MAWTDEHDAALRKYLHARLSFTQAAAAINAAFRTVYSRNAAIGRANRLGIKSLCAKFAGERPERSKSTERRQSPQRPKIQKDMPAPREFACDETGLRVADVIPRNITIDELTDETCRWPYGERPPFAYCGCEPFADSPYCEPHTALSQGQGNRGEQMAMRVPRLVA